MRFNINSLLEKASRKRRNYLYHRRHRLEAGVILKAIEGRHGRTDPAAIKAAYEYARDVLGGGRYAPWLYVYTAMNGVFREGWLPDNYYGTVVVPRIKGAYGKVCELKALTSMVFGEGALPDIAYFVNGNFYTAGGAPIPGAEVGGCLFSNTDRVIFKPDCSLQGRGILFFEKGGFDVRHIVLPGNGVFQGCIRQHRVFEAFAPRPVATLRITTALDGEDAVSVRACYLRLGRVGDSHVQSGSHIRIPIDLETGRFSDCGYLPDWRSVEAHPDSGVSFAGQAVPCFSECLEKVKHLHKKMPYTRCIGWDVTVDSEEKVVIMEWNADHNDIKFSEATQGPCFADLMWHKLWETPLA
jgi:hypothetical protein